MSPIKPGFTADSQPWLVLQVFTQLFLLLGRCHKSTLSYQHRTLISFLVQMYSYILILYPNIVSGSKGKQIAYSNDALRSWYLEVNSRKVFFYLRFFIYFYTDSLLYIYLFIHLIIQNLHICVRNSAKAKRLICGIKEINI